MAEVRVPVDVQQGDPLVTSSRVGQAAEQDRAVATTDDDGQASGVQRGGDRLGQQQGD